MGVTLDGRRFIDKVNLVPEKSGLQGRWWQHHQPWLTDATDRGIRGRPL